MYNKLFLLAAVTLSCAARLHLPACEKTTSGSLQKAAPDSTDQNRSSGNQETPTYSLEFKSPELIQEMGPSPLLEVPFQCTSDGAVFIDTLDPKDVMAHTLYSVLNKSVRKFSLTAINDLGDLDTVDYFPGSSTVDFLVQASTKSLPRSGGAISADTEKIHTEHHARHFFVAEFDREGNYKKSIQLGIDFPLFRFAVLSTGEFLVAGYDSATDSERLLLLDDAGQIVKSIDQPLSTKERSARRDASPDQRMLAGAQSAGKTNFVAYKDSVLAWRSGTKDSILEIRAGGGTREVPIAVPAGSSLADVLPSDDRWVIHVASASLPENGPRDLSSFTYFEVSPLDGSLLRKLTIVNQNIGSIACKARGNYYAFSTDKDQKVVEFVAPDR
jgi:hypothetical protein